MDEGPEILRVDPDSDKVDLDELFGESFDDSDAPKEPEVANLTAHLRIPHVAHQKPEEITFSIRTPNFLKFQPKEYSSDSFDAAVERKSFDAAQAIVRWRHRRDNSGRIERASDGSIVRESNARLVKWSDGTYQIVVGDQVFNTSLAAIDNTYGPFHPP